MHCTWHRLITTKRRERKTKKRSNRGLKSFQKTSATLYLEICYSCNLLFDELGGGSGTNFELLLDFSDRAALGASEAEEQRERRREAIDLTIESSIIVLTNLLFAGITVLPLFGVNLDSVLARIAFWSSEFISTTFSGFVMGLLALNIPSLWFSSITFCLPVFLYLPSLKKNCVLCKPLSLLLSSSCFSNVKKTRSPQQNCATSV